MVGSEAARGARGPGAAARRNRPKNRFRPPPPGQLPPPAEAELGTRAAAPPPLPVGDQFSGARAVRQMRSCASSAIIGGRSGLRGPGGQRRRGGGRFDAPPPARAEGPVGSAEGERERERGQRYVHLRCWARGWSVFGKGAQQHCASNSGSDHTPATDYTEKKQGEAVAGRPARVCHHAVPRVKGEKGRSTNAHKSISTRKRTMPAAAALASAAAASVSALSRAWAGKQGGCTWNAHLRPWRQTGAHPKTGRRAETRWGLAECHPQNKGVFSRAAKQRGRGRA